MFDADTMGCNQRKHVFEDKIMIVISLCCAFTASTRSTRLVAAKGCRFGFDVRQLDVDQPSFRERRISKPSCDNSLLIGVSSHWVRHSDSMDIFAS